MIADGRRRAPAQGPMISSARRARLGGCRFRVISRSRPQCRVGDFARRFGLAASQGFRDDASTAARRRRFGAQSTKCRLLARRLSPTKHRVRPWRPLQDTSNTRRQCPPSVCALRRSHLPLQRRLSTSIACGITASLPASLFRPAGAGRSPIGRLGELLRSEKRRTTRHKPYGAANAAILGRPHLAPGDSQGDRSPLEPCPPPRN